MNKFEQALQRTQAELDAAINAALAAVNTLKRARKSVQTGDIKPLPRQFDAADAAIDKLTETLRQTRESWDFDADAYFSGSDFIEEIMSEAERAGISIHEMDGRLFCYPCILKPLPADYAVMIDKKREKRLRPSVFVKLLQVIQNRPPKFRPEAFLESLFDAYRVICEQKSGRGTTHGPDISLLDIYKLLTLLPGQSREYSRQEFARDIYLLDQSHVVITKDNFRASLGDSSGTRSPARCLRIVTRDGKEKLYSSITFTPNE